MESKNIDNSFSIRGKSISTRIISKLFFYGLLIGIWAILARRVGVSFLLPTPMETFKGLWESILDIEIINNIGITMVRVLKGWLIALVIGVPLGLAMGLSKTFNFFFGGILNSLRQVPMMAWVPLTIIWLGIGDGPTLFMIAINGLFQVVLNTTQGVEGISKDYYNAARSMGASKLSIFFNIILPAALPDILVGARLAIGSGWMSVICAEFIATSSGLGYSMVEAQARLKTNVLLALMIVSAFLGYFIDVILQLINHKLTKWRFEQ